MTKPLTKGRGFMKRPPPLLGKLLLCMLIPLILSVIIIFIFMITTDVTDFISMTSYSNRAVSLQTTYKLLNAEKEVNNALTNASNAANDRWKNATFDASAFLNDSRKLSPERFSTDKGYIDGYVEINEWLLAHTSSAGSFTVNGVEFDGLAYMTMCNDESVSWLRDSTKTLSSVFPSRLIDINMSNYKQAIPGLSIIDVFTSPDSYNLPMYGVEYGSPWIGDWSTQGPATSAFMAGTHDTALNQATNEYNLLNDDPATIKNIDTISKVPNGDLTKLILSECTGSGKETGWGKISDYGDRWNIHNGAAVFKYNMETYLPKYVEGYTALYDETVTKYHLLCFMQMQHWYGAGYSYFDSMYIADPGCGGMNDHFSRAGVWPVLIKGICHPSSLVIIQQSIYDDLERADGEMIDYNDGYHEGVVVDVLANIDTMKLEYTSDDGNTYTFDSSKDLLDDQGRSEFIHFVYNYMMLDYLFSEGGTNEAS